MSQKAFLMGEEHVFGQHETTQTSIASIEKAAGLYFWSLAELDPLAKEEEGVGPPLTDVTQIRFFLTAPGRALNNVLIASAGLANTVKPIRALRCQIFSLGDSFFIKIVPRIRISGCIRGKDSFLPIANVCFRKLSHFLATFRVLQCPDLRPCDLIIPFLNRFLPRIYDNKAEHTGTERNTEGENL
jgi:hypothetical protein